MSTTFRFLACSWILAATAKAEVALGPLFSDHVVLQCDKAVPVWGTAAPGEEVTVTYQQQRVSARADPDGRWVVILDPMPANAGGGDLIAAGTTTAVARDVLVGEVWLASGQSNMEFVVDDPNGAVFHVENAAAEVAAANYPLIRQFTVTRRVSEHPLDTLAGSWAPCTPRTVSEFSAVAYFFARDLYRRLGVPIGIIDSTWGGTPVESWMSPLAIASDPAFKVVAERWRKNLEEYPHAKKVAEQARAAWQLAADAAHQHGPVAFAQFNAEHPEPRLARGPGDSWTPEGLFNAMINPLTPYALRGAIWYQGESNAERPREYGPLFAALISSWRAHFGQGDFPFYWVQLANYNVPGDASGQSWAWLREAQTQTLALPDTGQAVTIDIGDPVNIHPRNKQEVGRRLALLAKVRTYGIPGDDSGPVFVSATPERSALRLHFRFGDAGLTAGLKPLAAFEVAGADHKFYPATATISGNTVLVQSAAVPVPVAVRYAWKNAPDANFFNGAGLPAGPFRSDRW